MNFDDVTNTIKNCSLVKISLIVEKFIKQEIFTYLFSYFHILLKSFCFHILLKTRYSYVLMFALV